MRIRRGLVRSKEGGVRRMRRRIENKLGIRRGLVRSEEEDEEEEEKEEEDRKNRNKKNKNIPISSTASPPPKATASFVPRGIRNRSCRSV